MSVRRAVARPADSGDLMVEAVDYERSAELAEYQKVALRLQKVFLTNPAGLDDELRAQVFEHFSTVQVVELAFKYFYWSTNKPNVALAMDAPHDENRLRVFHYTEDGVYTVHAVED